MYKVLIQKKKKQLKKQKQKNKLLTKRCVIYIRTFCWKNGGTTIKILDKIGLIIFSNIVLILSIILCLLIFGWLSPETVYEITKIALNDPVTTKIVLGLAIAFIILAIKCIFFTSEKKQLNGIKDGILLQNSDGQLVISKTTLEELVNNVVKGFDSAQNVSSKIVLDEEKNLIVYVTIDVKQNAVIKELSNNLQTKIKSAIKNTSDLEVKEVNISVKELQTEQKQDLN